MITPELLGKLKIEALEEKGGYGKFTFEPLPIGYGQTLGNSLRRVLLSSLPGAAVTFVKLDGVSHQFSTIPGVREDVTDLIQNFKKIRLKIFNDQPVILKLEAQGPSKVTASDFEVIGSGEIVSKSQEIATLSDKKTKLVAELTAEPGFGYVPSEEHQTAKIGVIPVDSIFTPVTQVNYKVEQTRLGQVTNLEKLVLEMETDGTITPKEALRKASEILVSYFKSIAGGKSSETAVARKNDEKKSQVSEADLAVSIEDLGLSTRTTNALLKARVKIFKDLCEKSSGSLEKMRGLGEKGVAEIKDLLGKYNLS